MVIPMNCRFRTIISPIYMALSRNTFATTIYANIAKNFDLISKEFLGLCCFLIKDG